jgi:hypothetical protein
MKNEVKNTCAIVRSKPHIRPEDEEKIKEERNDEKDRFDFLKLNLEADNAKIVQLDTEPVVGYCM